MYLKYLKQNIGKELFLLDDSLLFNCLIYSKFHLEMNKYKKPTTKRLINNIWSKIL